MKTNRLFKSIAVLAALTLAGASEALAGDVTTLYERSVANEAGIQVWNAETDIAEGEWTGDGGSIDETDGLKVYKKKGNVTLSKTISPAANVLLTIDAQLKFGGAASASTHQYFRLFDSKLLLDLTNKTKSMTVKIGDATVKSEGSYDRSTDLDLHLKVNTATGAIQELTLMQGETSFLALEDIEDEANRTFPSGTDYTKMAMQVNASAYDGTIWLRTVKVQQETQTVATYGYTVNYVAGEAVVKTVTSSLAEGAQIPVETAITGDDELRYLIVADAAPVQAVTTDASQNVLNIDVRRPYGSTLNVYRVLDGVQEAEPYITKALTETDSKVANWVYTFPLCVQVDDVWYETTTIDGKFGEQGTFTNDPVVKTVAYTSNADIVGFWDESHDGTKDNMAYSGGSFNTYWRESAIGTLQAGTYEMTAMQIGNYGCTLYAGWTDADNRGTSLAVFGQNARTAVFTLAEDAENVRLYQGSNARMDYILLKKSPKATVTIGEPACYADAYANDQDWALMYWLLVNK